MKINSIDFVKDPIQHGGNRLQKNFQRKNYEQPLITVITVVLNGEKNLEDCFKSLHQQNYKNIEHIVIDGGSTDNSLNTTKICRVKNRQRCGKSGSIGAEIK